MQTRAGLPGRCGLLSGSASQGRTEPPVITMAVDREVCRLRAETRALRSAVKVEGMHPLSLTAQANRNNRALTARVAGPGRSIFRVLPQLKLLCFARKGRSERSAFRLKS